MFRKVKKVGSEQLTKYLTKYCTNIQHYLRIPKVKEIEGNGLLPES
jgi:hypothetical protein